MSEPENTELESVGRLTGKTTVHTVQAIITNPKIQRNSYFTIYGSEDEEGNKPYFVLNIIEMWSDSSGLMAKLQVLGERPQRPFDVGAEVYLASKEHITTILGINNPPEESVSIGLLLGYDFDVNLLVKNFGRIFITGKSGSGKSYTMGVLIEEFLAKNIPVVIIDRHGEYGSLKVASEGDNNSVEDSSEVKGSEFCPWCGCQVQNSPETCPDCGKSLALELLDVPKSEDGEPEKEPSDQPIKKLGTAKESDFVDKIIEFSDLKINRGADIDIEYLFSLEARDIVAKGLCTIVNLRGIDLEVQEIISGRLFKKLYQASTSRQIPPFYLFLDEAHLFAGKKQTETCEVVKLFAQEGRKFGANIVIGTQRPQLLDVTIRAQAGTWIVHNLTDVRDIGITISSAEDLTNSNKEDISGLDKGQAIICGEAVAGIPLFIKVRKRKTKHGGVGFNALDFLPDDAVEELEKKKERILGLKSDEELEAGKIMYQDLTAPKTTNDYIEEIRNLKLQVAKIQSEKEAPKPESKATEVISSDKQVNEKIKELELEVKVWKEKYNFLQQKSQVRQPTPTKAPINEQDQDQISELSEKILTLENEGDKWKKMYEDMKILAEKSIKELKQSDKSKKM